jgi:DNA invertase Pin-like site-specific DNA recombinase
VSRGDDLTESDDEMRVAMRQIAGVFSQLEKTRLVKKLKAARDRKRATGVKVEGRRSLAETRPEAVALAKRLHRASPKTGARELQKAGHVNVNGKLFNPASVKAMVEGRDCRK